MIHGTHRYPPMERVVYGIPFAEALAEEVERLDAACGLCAWRAAR